MFFSFSYNTRHASANQLQQNLLTNRPNSFDVFFSCLKTNQVYFIGLILISAYVDPANQPIAQGDQLYQIGIIDRSEKEIFDDYERKWIELINTKKWLEVYSIGSEQFSFFINVTGLQTGDNFLLTNDPIEWFNYDYLMADCDIRQAIHVGNQVFADLSDQVNLFLAEDLGQSMVPTLAFLMNNYRVMLMNGDLDLICSQVSTEKFLNNMDWKRKKEYAAAKKIIWKVQDSDEEVAGYIRQVGEDFVQASVRNCELSFLDLRYRHGSINNGLFSSRT